VALPAGVDHLLTNAREAEEDVRKDKPKAEDQCTGPNRERVGELQRVLTPETTVNKSFLIQMPAGGHRKARTASLLCMGADSTQKKKEDGKATEKIQ